MIKLIQGDCLEKIAELYAIDRHIYIINLPFKHFIRFDEKNRSLRKRVLKTRLKAGHSIPAFLYNLVNPPKRIFWLIRFFQFFRNYRFIGIYIWNEEIERLKNDF